LLVEIRIAIRDFNRFKNSMFCLRGLVPVGGGRCGEMVKDGEHGTNTEYTCM
jgi:hypothetical protein